MLSMKTISIKRRYKILIIPFLVIAFLLLIVPYVIPVSYAVSGIPAESLASPAGRFLNIGAHTIYVEEQGPRSATAIVFIHGFGGSAYTWRNNIPFFANQGYHIIALDLKGFGLSSRDFTSDYSHSAQAKLVAEVLNQTGVKQAYLIGHSMGASVMFHFALLYTERVLGLVSVDGAIDLKESSSVPSILLSFAPFQRAGRVFLTRYVNKTRLATMLESACSRKEIVTPELIEAYYDRAIRQGWDESLLAMTRDMSRNAINFPPGSLQFPVLILRGTNDSWVSQAKTDEWKARIPEYTFYQIPDSGHLPMEEQPSIFNAKVLGFLRSNGN
jgi:pimeloyl-ACP methyl ester carboxylesterase